MKFRKWERKRREEGERERSKELLLLLLARWCTPMGFLGGMRAGCMPVPQTYHYHAIAPRQAVLHFLPKSTATGGHGAIIFLFFAFF